MIDWLISVYDWLNGLPLIVYLLANSLLFYFKGRRDGRKEL